MRSNIFDFATSELSQDAFLCWLLQWADTRCAEESSALHRAGRHLLSAMLEMHTGALRETTTVDIHRQFGGADVVCIIDGHLALLIEDKKNADVHGDQLGRYIEVIRKRLPECAVLPTYVKTGDQSSVDYKAVEEKGYKLFLRGDLLKVLRTERIAGVGSDIFSDFLENLEEHEADVASFSNKPVDDWTEKYYPWIGFYQQLEREFAGLNWSYVPLGDFLGAWWSPKVWEDCTVYLLIAQGNLWFKINVSKMEKASDERDRWRAQLLESTEHFKDPLPLTRPRRLGFGGDITVAIVERSAWMAQRPDGLIDMAGTLSNLRIAEKMIEAALVSKDNDK